MKKIIVLLIVLLSTQTMQSQNEPYHSDVEWVTNPSHVNWLYNVKDQAKITIELYLYGVLQKDFEVSYSIGPELMKADKEGKVKLVAGKTDLILGTLNKPGFLDCRLKAEINGKTYSHHIKVGFEPQKLQPYTQFPADFTSFWDQAKAEAALCPFKVEKTLASEYCTDKVDCYLVKIQAYKEGYNVYGYLTVPKKEGKYPVVFSPPGAGIKPMDPLTHTFYAENGVIRFDMEIHGIRPDLDAKTYKEISRSFGGGDNSYLINGIEDRDKYYMKKVYMSCIRVIDYLTTLPQWDGKNLIAQGTSQGGALVLVTTALDRRITACAATHPALCDMSGYLDNRAGGYPHLFTEYKNMDKPEIIKTLQYYDAVNFAKLINVPVFMTFGYNDNVCPPTTSYITYNSIKSDKKSLITPITEHWVSDNTRRVIFDWIKTQFK